MGNESLVLSHQLKQRDFACNRMQTTGAQGPLFAIALLVASVTSVRAQGNGSTERASIRVGVAQAIHLDGELREPVWQTADSIAPLTQVEPTQGAAPSARTVVRVVTTGDAIVFGIQADNPPGVGPVAFARQRDAVLDSEDHIKLVLDTYLDGRSGYVFAVNPYGARYDALVASQGEGEDANWDAVWEAATSRTVHGWSAEIRIPLKSLLFRRGLSEWGFNIQRRIQHLQETDRWTSPEQNYTVTHVTPTLWRDVDAKHVGGFTRIRNVEDVRGAAQDEQIGRASCRERV